MTTPAQPDPTPAPQPPPAPAPAPAPAPTPKTFTQDEVNAVAAREAAEAKRQASKELADRFGVSLDDAEKIIKEANERDAAALTEAERREAAAAERERKAVEAEASANAVLKRTRIRESLLSGEKPCRPDRVDFAVTNIVIPDDADDAALAQAVDAYREAVPEFFTQVPPLPTPRPTPGTPSSTPGTPPPQARPSEDAYAAGAERAKQMIDSGKAQ